MFKSSYEKGGHICIKFTVLFRWASASVFPMPRGDRGWWTLNINNLDFYHFFYLFIYILLILSTIIGADKAVKEVSPHVMANLLKQKSLFSSYRTTYTYRWSDMEDHNFEFRPLPPYLQHDPENGLRNSPGTSDLCGNPSSLDQRCSIGYSDP